MSSCLLEISALKRERHLKVNTPKSDLPFQIYSSTISPIVVNSNCLPQEALFLIPLFPLCPICIYFISSKYTWNLSASHYFQFYYYGSKLSFFVSQWDNCNSLHLVSLFPPLPLTLYSPLSIQSEPLKMLVTFLLCSKSCDGSIFHSE